MRTVRFRLHRAAVLGAVVLACALLASACGDDDDGGSSGASLELPGTQWVLDTTALGVEGAGDVTATLEFAKQRVSGSDGCNRFSGSYETDGSSLTFGPLAGTQMACIGPADEVGRKVGAALQRVRSATNDSEQLKLKDDGGSILLTYDASTPGVEGAWNVISVLYDDAIRSVATDTKLTATFGADGSLTGSTGCNSFHGSYTLDGTAIEVGPLAATKKACASKEASAQEAGYLAALESAVLIDQVADDLTLLNAKGQMAVTLKRG